MSNTRLEDRIKSLESQVFQLTQKVDAMKESSMHKSNVYEVVHKIASQKKRCRKALKIYKYLLDNDQITKKELKEKFNVGRTMLSGIKREWVRAQGFRMLGRGETDDSYIPKGSIVLTYDQVFYIKS